MTRDSLRAPRGTHRQRATYLERCDCLRGLAGGDVVRIFNDRGELILAKLSPDGYSELGRTKAIEPTSAPGGRRELGAVVWSHPAFANRHMVARNDRELVRLSLDADDYRRSP